MSKKKNSGNTLVDPSTKSIGAFLSSPQIIVIPPNQRPYAWEEKQVGEFLDDLEAARELNYGQKKKYWHYFNMVTYVRDINNKKKLYIHDGQQRITTSFITLFYLLNIYKIMKKQTFEEITNENMKKFEESLHVENNRKLHMFSQNDELIKVLYNLADSKNLIEELENKLIQDDYMTESNKRIVNLLKSIRNYMDSSVLDSILIEQLFNTLYNNFEIVLGELNNSHQAFKIFELVNNRGKSLSEIDLVKNFFYQIADQSGCNSDVAELEKKLGNIISRLGDDFEDAMTKHWLLYFNQSENTLKGKPNDLYKSVTSLVLEESSNSKKRDVVFNFIDHINSNIDYICNIFRIFNTKYEDFDSTSLKEYFESKEFDIRELKQIVVQRTFANSEFDYLDYYLYYCLFEYQKNGCSKRFKVFNEYQKAVKFYVFRSYVKSGSKINLDKLNYRLGNWIETCIDNENIDLNAIFVNFLKGESDIEESTTNYKKQLRDKIASPQQELKNSRARLLYQLIYGLDDPSFYYKYSKTEERYNIIEVEHILPKSSERKDFEQYDTFNLSHTDSIYKNKIEWLGNKLLLDRKENLAVSDSIEKKLTEYSYNTKFKLNQEYFIIFVKEFLNDQNIQREALLNQDRQKYIDETMNCIKKNKVTENEKKINNIEEKWRKYISDYVYEEDILSIGKWDDINVKEN